MLSLSVTHRVPSFCTNVARSVANGENVATFDASSSVWEFRRQGKLEVVWSPEDETPVFTLTGGIFKDAPHPNAAKLLVDFIISKEGQEVFRDADYITAHPDVPASVPTLKPAEGKFRVHFFTPEQTEDGMPEWKKVSDEFFR